MISRYIAEVLHRAQYRILDDGLFCATVAGLPGVIATGKTLEACRDQLAASLRSGCWCGWRTASESRA